MISALVIAALLAPGPFDELAKCDGPGAEPGRTALEICVPRLVRAWVDNGLVPIPEAKRLQPVPVGLFSIARVPISTRVDVVYWDGVSTHGVRGHRKLRLR